MAPHSADKTWWERAITTLGFPIVACAVLSGAAWQLYLDTRAQSKVLQDVVTQNTIAFRESSDGARSLKTAVDTLSDTITRRDRRITSVDGIDFPDEEIKPTKKTKTEVQ